mgnify:CR=1 FL=1
MKWFATGDFHFNHWNIVKYTNRPFKTIEHMNETLIKNYNERVKPEDHCIICGDFIFKNSAGGKPGEGLPEPWTKFWDRLNGIKTLVRGNHDRGNSAKTIVENMVVGFGGYRIGVIHDPADFLESVSWNEVDFNICSHVHNNWLYIFRGHQLEHFILNVGVDVHHFRPITFDEILKTRSRILKQQSSYRQRDEHNKLMAANYHKSTDDKQGELNEESGG